MVTRSELSTVATSGVAGDARVWAKAHVRWMAARALSVAIGTLRAAPPGRLPSTGLLDSRVTAGLRLALGLMTLLVFAVEFREAVRLFPVIMAYIGYASVAYVAAVRHWAAAVTLALNYRVDAAAFLFLISLTGATGGAVSFVFTIYLFFFAAMCASLAWGAGAGLRFTMTTAALVYAGLVGRAVIAHEFDAPRAWLCLGCILGLGSMAARWGGHQFTIHRRLALLRDAATLSNPRFGVDRTIATFLERLREFFEADVCLLLTRSTEDAGWRVRRCERHCPDGAGHEEMLSAELERALPSLPPDALAVYARRPPLLGWLPPARYWSEEWRADGRKGTHPISYRPAAIESLLTRCGGRSWLSVPVFAGKRWLGRLYVTSAQALTPSDARFVLPVVANSMLVIENNRLVDRLASSAADRERQRLARDIHDSVIQPYIGLQMGLTAVQRALTSHHLVAARDQVSRLLDLTGVAIDTLRANVGGWKSEAVRGGGNGLAQAVRRYAAEFTEDTRIAVDVVDDDQAQIGDRLGAELFQMIVESLSNLRRHTTSSSAVIRLSQEDGCITLEIENREASVVSPTAFMPRSINERADALGGHVTVLRFRDGRTIVSIKIPL